MKKLLFLSIFIFLSNVNAQEDAWVYFTDKPNTSTYIASPLTMLSQRALDRRAMQNINLDVTDVPIPQAYINQIKNATGITVMAKSKWLNALHIRGTITDIAALSSLSFVSTIKYANHSLNARLHSPKHKTKAVNKQLSVDETYNYGNSANQIQQLNGHLLHQQSFTGNGKIIAVLDSGFIGVDAVQPFQNLQTNNQILGGYNFPDRNTNFYTRHNHGTMVLSTMGGFTDNQLVGTAPNAKYYLFITEDVNSENPVEESYWVEAAERADSLGVDIINSSLGYFEYDNPAYTYAYADMNGVKSFASRGAAMAFAKGMICVISAGNSGSTSNPHIGTPADAFNALTVGAVNSTGAYVSFSSIGPSADGRVKPDVVAKGANATVSNTSGTITTASGTSFSSPITAGMIASLWSALPNKTNAEILQYIKQSGSNYATPNAEIGYGIPNFMAAYTLGLAQENTLSSKIIVYPNPASTYITFQLPEKPTDCILYIYDTLGRLALRETLTHVTSQINTSNLGRGTYFYELSLNGKPFYGVFLKD